jgi:hypothetical protein
MFDGLYDKSRVQIIISRLDEEPAPTTNNLDGIGRSQDLPDASSRSGNQVVSTRKLRAGHISSNEHTVVADIDSSLAAVPADFFGLCRKLARNRSTSS